MVAGEGADTGVTGATGKGAASTGTAGVVGGTKAAGEAGDDGGTTVDGCDGAVAASIAAGGIRVRTPIGWKKARRRTSISFDGWVTTGITAAAGFG
jgi:hypothetical protein